MTEIKANTILDMANASNSYVNSEIDSYDWVKIYDTTYGSTAGAFPKNPPSLHFRTNDISNWYDYRNAWFCIQFRIVKATADNTNDSVQTCRSDPIRQMIKKAAFKMNNTVITDCDHVGKYAVMDRACYSKQFYDTSAKEWLCYDEDFDSADTPPADHSNVGGVPHADRRPYGNAKWKTTGDQAHTYSTGVPPPNSIPQPDPSNTLYTPFDTFTGVVTPPAWWDLHTGIGKLYRLTNAYTVDTPAPGADGDNNHVEILHNTNIGSIVSCRIPLACIFRWNAFINCVLKNVIFDWRFELETNESAKMWAVPDNEVINEPINDQGFNLHNAWIELPRVIPSPSRLVSLNNSLIQSKKISISYPNYQVYQNTILSGLKEANFLIQNTTERVLRVTCFLQRVVRDTSSQFRPGNTICPDITEFSLQINGTTVPYTSYKNSFNSERFPYLATIQDPTNSLNGGINVDDAYRAYQEQCQNYYLMSPYNTKDGLLPRFMGASRLNPMQWACDSFYFTCDIARTRQSQMFLGGSASLSAQFRFAVDTPEAYYCYSIIEYSQLVDIDLQERAAFIVTS
jgi:hypothetical protein